MSELKADSRYFICLSLGRGDYFLLSLKDVTSYLENHHDRRIDASLLVKFDDGVD